MKAGYLERGIGCLVVLCGIALVGVPVVLLTGCAESAAGIGWKASADGTGSDVTGLSVGFAAAPLVTPAPTPWAIAGGAEQLEKGNSRKVAAQVAVKQILPMAVATPARPVAAPVTGDEGARSSGAWYNGFMP